MNTQKQKTKFQSAFSSSLSQIKRYFTSYIKTDLTDTEKKKELEKKLLFLVKGTAFGILSFIFAASDVMFSAYPFAPAFVGACGIFTPFAYIGAIIGALYLPFDATLTFLSLTLIVTARIFVYLKFTKKQHGRLFCESIAYRTVCCSAGCVLLSLFRCISGGFLYYDLFGMITLLGFGVPLCMMYTLAFDKRYAHSSLRDMGLLALSASFIYSIRTVSVLGFSLGAVLLFILTLYVSRTLGMLKGGILGLVCGLAFSVRLCPMFALVGLIGGFFSRIGLTASCIASLGTAVLYSVYLDGSTALISLAPDLLCASIIYVPLAYFNVFPKSLIISGDETLKKHKAENFAAKEKGNSQTKAFEEMRDAFSSLSDVCFRLSEKSKIPRPEEIAVGCEAVLRRHCLDCAKYQSCNDMESHDTLGCAKTISKALFREKAIAENSIPEYMRRKCFKLDKVIDDLNKEYSDLVKKRMCENKADVFAADYEAMARLIGDAVERTKSEFAEDDILTEKAIKAAGYIGVTAESISVYGKRRKKLVMRGVDMARIKTGADDLRRVFGKVCSIDFSEPVFTVDDGCVSMTLSQKNTYKCDFARIYLQKNGENVCGDSVVSFKGGDGYEYVLLSDGMGSGYEAALTSRLCGVFLEKMLKCGNRKDITLDMLNSLIRSKAPECFATVDLLEFDLVSGMGSFVKSGSAPSYVYRNGNLFRVESDSTPIGITRKITGEQIDFALCDGDLVIMVSDGIAQSFEDGLWLCNLISEKADCEDINTLCSSILEKAKEENQRSDDMSVAVLKVSKCA